MACEKMRGMEESGSRRLRRGMKRLARTQDELESALQADKAETSKDDRGKVNDPALLKPRTKHPSPFSRLTSKPPAKPLYNPHLQAPLGSAGNKGLIALLESALTGNSPVTPVESALTKTGGWGPSGSLFWIIPPLVCRRFDLANAKAQSSRVGRVFRTSAALGRWSTGS